MPETTKSTFKEEYYVEGYKLASSGLSETKIARALGVSKVTLRKWRKRFPSFDRAIKEGRNGIVKQDQKTVKTFLDYVFDRLTPKMKRLWTKVLGWQKEKNGVVRIERMLEKQGLRVRQTLFVHAYIHCSFDASMACKMVNVSKRTFDNWRRNDPEFADLWAEMDWHLAERFKGALVEGVLEYRNPLLIKFANETFNDKQFGKKVKVTGSVGHLHAHVVDVDSLNLPLDTRRQLLNAMRQKELPEHVQVEDAEFTVKEKTDER